MEELKKILFNMEKDTISMEEMRATPKKTKPCFGIVLNGQEDFGYDQYGPVSDINPVW